MPVLSNCVYLCRSAGKYFIMAEANVQSLRINPVPASAGWVKAFLRVGHDLFPQRNHPTRYFGIGIGIGIAIGDRLCFLHELKRPISDCDCDPDSDSE